jgi:hypothetical protein
MSMPSTHSHAPETSHLSMTARKHRPKRTEAWRHLSRHRKGKLTSARAAQGSPQHVEGWAVASFRLRRNLDLDQGKKRFGLLLV